MKIRDVRSGLSKGIFPLLSEYGFSDRNHDGNFIRFCEDALFVFKLQVYAKKGWFFVKPLVAVGSPVLNNLYNQIVQPKDSVAIRGRTVGLGFGVSNEFPGRGDYNIENVEEILSAAANIRNDFLEIALPFFEKNNTVELMKKTLNRRTPDGAYIPTTTSAACMGIIAANLCGRKDTEALANFHYDFLSKAQNREIAAPILKVKEHCLQNSSSSHVALPVLKLKTMG